ncbi:hypothetical protein [Winogradskyella sp. 3972H.M.0a.05]|uniref:hypothetical protein n=1 Tax=Winogradskyella sp. 3972H.M.0a.05 TaxID=2950277 RepID=UPI003392A2DA
MKSFIALFTLLFFNITIAQDSVELTSFDSLDITLTETNSDFEYPFKSLNDSRVVEKLRHKVNSINIKDLSVYNDSEPSYYNISVVEGRNKIIAKFNSEGELLSTNETYFDIPLPLTVRQEVARKFPNWEIVNTKLKFTFVKNKTPKSEYRVSVSLNGVDASLVITL